MTARISLILGKSGAHRAPLQLRFFTAPVTARSSFRLELVSNVQRKTRGHRPRLQSRGHPEFHDVRISEIALRTPPSLQPTSTPGALMFGFTCFVRLLTAVECGASAPRRARVTGAWVGAGWNRWNRSEPCSPFRQGNSEIAETGP